MARLSFMDLPTECRLRVYDFIFGNEPALIRLALDAVYHCDVYIGKLKPRQVFVPPAVCLEVADSPTDHPLLAVSKQIRVEALDRFRPVTLVLDEMHNAHFPIFEDFVTNRLPERMQQAITRIEIEDVDICALTLLEKIQIPTLQVLQVAAINQMFEGRLDSVSLEGRGGIEAVKDGAYDSKIVVAAYYNATAHYFFEYPCGVEGDFNENEYLNFQPGPGEVERTDYFRRDNPLFADRGFELLCKTELAIECPERKQYFALDVSMSFAQ